ncbi:hypothetical protein PLESTB_001916500 [Pleodorina starrii]|uniref:Methyltransferase domain-containing protein n=1 Tax=Pleodorina starrii TaxID=330485 RepID=A0A9W6C497_9CHLO|nr:hypothetical protein PLESTB_001916500 [Pleodorina starrii]
MVLDHHGEGTVVDIGCGTGHVTAELAHRGLEVVGIDPSEAMLGIARRSHPEMVFRRGGANLYDSPEPTDQLVPLRGVLARFSLIHIDPDLIGGVLDSWAQRMPAGGVVLLAFQSTDGEGQPVVSFDHAVAPAWRWHPEEMSARLARAGFDEAWRTMSRPDSLHRFLDTERKRELIAELTNTYARVMNMRPDTIRVVIEEFPRENWGVAGVTLADSGQNESLNAPGNSTSS